jgi:hypothetical protein
MSERKDIPIAGKCMFQIDSGITVLGAIEKLRGEGFKLISATFFQGETKKRIDADLASGTLAQVPNADSVHILCERVKL